MTISEAEALLDRAVQYGCDGDIKQCRDGSWRVYISEDGHWTFVVDDDDLDHALENPEIWMKGDF